jgi:hypothetical protein
MSKRGGSRCVIIDRAVLALAHIDPEGRIDAAHGPGACIRLSAAADTDDGLASRLVNQGNAKAFALSSLQFACAGIDPDGRVEICISGHELILRRPIEDRPVIMLDDEAMK